MTSDTPRTDAAWKAAFRSTSIDAESIRDFAQILERKGNAASAEIEAMREAIKEAHGALQMVVLETLKQWDSTKPLPCVGTIENAANVALTKLQPFIKP